MKIKFIALVLATFFMVLFACQNSTNKSSQNLTEETEKAYLKNGKSIAAKSFMNLSEALQKAMQEGGIPNAVKYCNLNALPIMDSLSKTENAIIRRTSLKVRNSNNEPTAEELKILRQFHKADEKGEEITPIVEQLGDHQIAFYAPIRVNEFCLKCHGKLEETLTKENFAILQNHYPKDKAIGYSAGDLRGMWSIRFSK